MRFVSGVCSPRPWHAKPGFYDAIEQRVAGAVGDAAAQGYERRRAPYQSLNNLRLTHVLWRISETYRSAKSESHDLHISGDVGQQFCHQLSDFCAQAVIATSQPSRVHVFRVSLHPRCSAVVLCCASADGQCYVDSSAVRGAAARCARPRARQKLERGVPRPMQTKHNEVRLFQQMSAGQS
jgi:hypothetical protein